MRTPLFTALIVAAVACGVCPPARADTVASDQVPAILYRLATQHLVEFNPGQPYAIWSRTVGADAIYSERTPRHHPIAQFSRTLPGVDAALELALALNNLDRRTLDGAHHPYAPVQFDDAADSARFQGFRDSAEFESRAAAAPSDPARALLGVAFSAVGFGEGGRSALLYSESCLVVPMPTCIGEGYLFVREADDWHLRQHRALWSASGPAFWSESSR